MSPHPKSDGDRVVLIADFVAKLKSEPRAGLLALRAIALSLGPDVSERVTSSAVTYERRSAPFLIVEPDRSRLIAGFPLAIKMDDPSGRLLRRGEFRYFRVDAAGDLDAHVQEFVRKAYSAAR